MKKTFTWVGLALATAMVLTLTSCGFFEELFGGLDGSEELSEDFHYYTEVGIRAENIRATCRKVCLNGFNNGDSLVVLPTGDTLFGPMNAQDKDTCIMICNDHSELSPEFIALERSHLQTAKDLGQKNVEKLSNKFIILASLPLFVWDFIAPLMVPTKPPIGGGDCGMYSCLGHVHLTRTSPTDSFFRVISAVPDNTVLVDVVIKNDSGVTLVNLDTEATLYSGRNRQSKVAWSTLCSPSLQMQSLQLGVRRYVTSGDYEENTTWTPIWFNQICQE